jgi:transposase
LSVVQEYRAGDAGYQLLAQFHGLDYSMLKRWVDAHRLRGLAGLTKKFRHYSSAFKLFVLQHKQLMGINANYSIQFIILIFIQL